jgi:hypothetical protein
MTLDEALNGWSAKTSMLGIREYYSVNTWDRDLPAAARGGNIAYLQRTIPEFYSKGARFMSAESSDNWGPNGVGYYLASRMLWDINQAKHTDELMNDFLTRAFGPAQEPMREFYRQIDGSQPHLVMSDQLGRMFRALQQARENASDHADVIARIDDLTQYAHYVDLYQQYAKASGPARQAAFEQLIRHAYRMRRTMMIHTKGLYRDLVARDKTVTLPADAKWNVPEGKNPWKSSEAFAPAELAQFITSGIERYPLSQIDFKPVAYSDDLVSAAALHPPETLPAQAGVFAPGRGRQTFYTRVDHAPADIDLLLTGGLIAHYRDRGNVKIKLWKIGGASATGERETLISEDHSTPPDGNEHAVKLTATETGLYRITLDDGSDETLFKWNAKLPLVIKSSADEPMSKRYGSLWQLCFYVPKGTKLIGFFGGEHGELHDSHGRPVFWLNGRDPNYYSVAVPDGEDGAFWTVRYGRGSLQLLTVPPYLARTPAELLLPAEVVARDATSK